MRSLLVLCVLVAVAAAYESETQPPTVSSPAKEIPSNEYKFTYGLTDYDKELELSFSSGGGSDDVNKAFFEYTNSKGQIYRTDLISDAAHKATVL